MRIYLSEIGAIHFFAACASLALGLAVLMLRKGTRVHRALGLTYVFAMLSVNGSALMLYHLTGHFEVFHGLALVSLFGVIRGVSAAIFKWKDWLLSHFLCRAAGRRRGGGDGSDSGVACAYGRGGDRDRRGYRGPVHGSRNCRRPALSTDDRGDEVKLA